MRRMPVCWNSIFFNTSGFGGFGPTCINAESAQKLLIGQLVRVRERGWLKRTNYLLRDRGFAARACLMTRKAILSRLAGKRS
jgi:hypothetical protein